MWLGDISNPSTKYENNSKCDVQDMLHWSVSYLQFLVTSVRCCMTGVIDTFETRVLIK